MDICLYLATRVDTISSLRGMTWTAGGLALVCVVCCFVLFACWVASTRVNDTWYEVLVERDGNN